MVFSSSFIHSLVYQFSHRGNPSLRLARNRIHGLQLTYNELIDFQLVYNGLSELSSSKIAFSFPKTNTVAFRSPNMSRLTIQPAYNGLTSLQLIYYELPDFSSRLKWVSRSSTCLYYASARLLQTSQSLNSPIMWSQVLQLTRLTQLLDFELSYRGVTVSSATISYAPWSLSSPVMGSRQ